MSRVDNFTISGTTCIIVILSKCEGIMTCGIYAIVNKVNGKRYVGKSINIESRWRSHLLQLRASVRSKDCNRHLYAAFNKYGEPSFGFEYLEVFDFCSEEHIKTRELFWMEELKSINRKFGYNLRRDSSTSCIVHDETRELQSKQSTGENNPNYGNNWTDEQKARMSEIAISRHKSGKYSSAETKQKHSDAAKKLWSDHDKKDQMAENVSISRTTYKIGQYDKKGNLIKIWDRMKLIIDENPDYFRIAIYNCINGHKKSYRGFIWKKVI